MLKKISCAAAVLFAAAAVFAAPVQVVKKFELSSNNAAVKAGEVVKFKIAFECEPGAELGSYKAYVRRKEAPAEFFTQEAASIRWYDRKTQKANNYDTIYLTDDKNFPTRLASGECEVVINTTGMPAGDYAVGVQSWILKDKKSYYKAAVFYLTITEADGKKFVPTPQVIPAAAQRKVAAKAAPKTAPKPAAKAPTWYKSFTAAPAALEGASGTKYTVNCDFTASEKYFFGGYCVKILRKDAPKAFFDLPGLDMRYRFKDTKKVDGYDYAIVVKFKHMASVESQKFSFELDTANYPAGNYRIAVEIRLVDRATGKTSYPSIFMPLTVK